VSGPDVGFLVVYLALLLGLAWPLGIYMARVYANQPLPLDAVLGPLERGLYRLAGTRPEAEMDGRQYSRKNGRLSGKKTSNRWLTVTCGSSDSTWLKSGLAVASRTRLSRKTVLKSTPPSSSPGSETYRGKDSSRSSSARKERKNP
jgi:hypothetical protein